MSDKEKPFSASRWNFDPKAKVIGHSEQTEEERKKSKEILNKILKERSIKE